MMQECRNATKNPKIKVEENGRKAIFSNDNRDEYILTRYDGCVVKNEIGADWIISKEGLGDVIVELKGCNVLYAARQVSETASFLQKNNMRNSKIGGLIICRQYPRENTLIQRAKLDFQKKFSGPLKI